MIIRSINFLPYNDETCHIVSFEGCDPFSLKKITPILSKKRLIYCYHNSKQLFIKKSILPADVEHCHILSTEMYDEIERRAVQTNFSSPLETFAMMSQKTYEERRKM